MGPSHQHRDTDTHFTWHPALPPQRCLCMGIHDRVTSRLGDSVVEFELYLISHHPLCHTSTIHSWSCCLTQLALRQKTRVDKGASGARPLGFVSD